MKINLSLEYHAHNKTKNMFVYVIWYDHIWGTPIRKLNIFMYKYMRDIIWKYLISVNLQDYISTRYWTVMLSVLFIYFCILIKVL